MTADAPALRRVPFADTIPWIIHQTFPRAELPPALAANTAALRRMNPEWDYRLYDDAAVRAFVEAEYGPAVLDRFDRIDPVYGAARADLFRYLVVYRYGGVYLDVKAVAERALHEALLPGDQLVLSQWQSQGSGRGGTERVNWGLHAPLAHIAGGEYQQWHVIAAPGHPLLRAVILAVLAGIDAYRPWSYGVGRAAVLATTGPIAYSLAIHPMLADWPYRLVPDESALGLGYSFVEDFTHHRLFANHYTAAAAPLIRRDGAGGTIDRAYARLLRLRNRLAVATYPTRRLLRRLA